MRGAPKCTRELLGGQHLARGINGTKGHSNNIIVYNRLKSLQQDGKSDFTYLIPTACIYL